MTSAKVPFLPFPVNRQGRRLLHGFCPAGAIIAPLFPALRRDLEESGNALSETEYLAGAIIASLFFFAFAFAGAYFVANAYSNSANGGTIALLFASFAALSIFSYAMMHPQLLIHRAARDIERNLLYATRHLMIQTSAGVPLFDSIVSISEQYGDARLDYGAISAEFGKIAKEVRGGKELTDALEDSASRINSGYYQRLIWQLANANKAGANMGFVLRQMMQYLADEQRVLIRDYGSQLSPIAIFYMLSCIIAPTMGMIFLVIITSLVSIQVNEVLLGAMLLASVVLQVVFIGLIKSKRPVVAV